MKILPGNLDKLEVQRLLSEHALEMRKISPPESTHMLDLEQLRAPEVKFWCVWDGPSLVGCGALKQLDQNHAEIKSMRTSKLHRRKGVGKLMLQHLVDEACRSGCRRVSLETGSMEFFEPARTLYEEFGFTHCLPFADYKDDPNSVYMTLNLS